MSENPHVVAAIKRFGSEAKLAAAIGVSQPAVHKAKNAARLSAELAAAIHDATSGEIPRWETRPDLWDIPGAPESERVAP